MEIDEVMTKKVGKAPIPWDSFAVLHKAKDPASPLVIKDLTQPHFLHILATRDPEKNTMVFRGFLPGFQAMSGPWWIEKNDQYQVPQPCLIEMKSLKSLIDEWSKICQRRKPLLGSHLWCFLSR